MAVFLIDYLTLTSLKLEIKPGDNDDDFIAPRLMLNCLIFD